MLYFSPPGGEISKAYLYQSYYIVNQCSTFDRTCHIFIYYIEAQAKVCLKVLGGSIKAQSAYFLY